MTIRIGHGYDVHAFGDGDHVMLGGVRVPHDRGLVAHSDGDVILHALCDAIFGALAFRAIGDLLFVFDLDPLWQPLFQGVVLLLAVSLGAARLFQVRNRLDLFT